MAAAPWFCVKSTLLADTSPNYAPESHKKVFINICTRPTVPKAEELADDVLHDRLETPSESDPFLIPTVLAESREDVDKGPSNANGGPNLTRLFFSSGQVMPCYRLHHQPTEQGIGAETWKFIQDVPYRSAYSAFSTNPEHY